MDKAQYISILIIEDNPGDQVLLHENLISSNLLITDIIMVETLAEGISHLSKRNFSLIFLDLFLPDSTGLDSLSELIKINSRIPVIIYSGLSDTQIALKAITLGAQDFLVKGNYTVSLLEKTVLYSIERKSNLDALQESNARFTYISKATHDMVWDSDLITGKVYRDAEGWKKIFGTDESNETGTGEDWQSKVHPDDRERVKQELDDIIQSDDQEMFEMECRILRADNSIGFIEDRGYIIRNEKGKAIRLIGASQDITERKNAEAELKILSLVAKETINGVIISDKDRNVVWVNNAFTKMCGYKLDEVIGKKPMQFLQGPETDAEVVNYVKEQIVKKEPFVFEILNYTKAGEKFYVSVQLQPIFDENGDVKQYFALQTDITKQRELEENIELEKIIKQKEITEAVIAAEERERSEIGRELHDNINQLLGATRLYIDMARTDEESRDSLLTNASTYTLTAIEEIRKLSKTLITPLIKEIGLTDSIKDLSKEIMLVHPIKILFAAKDFIEDELNDKLKLNIFRIVQEQINNTLKHAQAKNININIEECDSNLSISIVDDGIGFDISKRKAGVGLTNIKSRSELYNGTVLLTSEQGKGTTLSITFNKTYLSLNDHKQSDS